MLCGFNSTLVRLEAKAPMLNIDEDGVSIPLWFDWKMRESFADMASLSFNSTLVRLEGKNSLHSCCY